MKSFMMNVPNNVAARRMTSLKTWLVILTLTFAPFADLFAQSGTPRPSTNQTSNQQSPPRPQTQQNQPPPTQQSNQPPTSNQSPEENVELGDEDEIEINTELVNVLFAAQDKNRRFLTDLKQEDFRILEDGVPQDIFTFQKQTDLPISLAIVMDKSWSQADTLSEQRLAANTFIDSILRPGKDEAAIVAFAGEVELEQGLTGNPRLIKSAVERVRFIPPTGFDASGRQIPGTPPISQQNINLITSTAMRDAIWATTNEVLSTAPQQTRRAVILLTDGQDTASQVNMDETIKRALQSEAIVYSIGIASFFRGYYEIDKGALRKISERTGGRAFFPQSEAELREAFRQIETELRQQYLIAYSPKNKARDGSFRRVELQIVNSDLKKQKPILNYRQGYFAKGGNGTRAAHNNR